MFKNLGTLCFGEIWIGSGHWFVDLPGLSWDPRPGLMGRGGRGRLDDLGLILVLKEQLMYPLSNTVKQFRIALSVLLFPCMGPMPTDLKTGMILLVDLWYLVQVDLWGFCSDGAE